MACAAASVFAQSVRASVTNSGRDFTDSTVLLISSDGKAHPLVSMGFESIPELNKHMDDDEDLQAQTKQIKSVREAPLFVMT